MAFIIDNQRVKRVRFYLTDLRVCELLSGDVRDNKRGH